MWARGKYLACVVVPNTNIHRRLRPLLQQWLLLETIIPFGRMLVVLLEQLFVNAPQHIAILEYSHPGVDGISGCSKTKKVIFQINKG